MASTRADFIWEEPRLGAGSFGRVKLATHRATGTVCAVKILSKALVVMTRQARNVKSERELLLTLRHPLILRCHGSFADEDRLYLVLELVTGGELAAVLKRRGPPRAGTTRP